ncbi:nucleoporin Nup188 [Phlebotomus argentipes]|uniref:nucleoporin Nup188 n=1 Tax=Phlebotomus argentipes TaxID=94469 RepID=UPI002893330A|nr:nucleoporin Nup188 [Phlebotomus argentipes]
MTESAKELIQWKLLWKLVSGNHYDTPEEDVYDKLSEVVDELRLGLKQYGKSNVKSDGKLQDVVKKAGQEKLLNFCQRLQHFLDIDALQTWSLLCSYLVTEYKGAPNSLPLYTANEENMMQFLQDIWNFYSMERMVVLKILRNILEFHNSHVHPYAETYDKILMEIGVKKLRESLLKQLEELIKETPPVVSSNFGEQLFNKVPQWCERKLKEINEVLHLLILIVNLDGIPVDELKQLMDLFKYHSFGRQHQYLEKSAHNDLANKINFSEVALFIQCVDLSDRKNSEQWLADVLKLDKDILALHQQVEHGPILLFWMLLNFRLAITLNDEEVARKYTRCGARAVQLGVYQYLTDMIREPMFKEASLLSRIVRTSVYENLGFLCDLFDEDGSVGMKPGVFDLLSELLKSPAIAGMFCQPGDTPRGVKSLFNTAIEYFPAEVLPLAQLATSLATAGAASCAFVKEHLMDLPVYTEPQSQKQFDLRSTAQEDEYVLGEDYAPFPDILYVIPKGTLVVVIDKKDHTLIHFKNKLDFFNVLHHEMNELIRESQQFTRINTNQLERITAGIKCLVSILRRIKSPADITESMVFPTEVVFFLLDRFREAQEPSMELMACCLDVCTALVPLLPEEILRRVINRSILPTIPNKTLSYEEYARVMSFNSGNVGYYLLNCETSTGKYDFLNAYFRFLKAASAGEGDSDRVYNIELPGLLFLLHAVFPHCHSWKFLDETDKYSIYIFALEYFLRILQDGVSGKEHRRLLVDVTIFSLLNLDCGLTLLRFVGVGNGNLETLVQAGTNWMTIANTGLNLIIQLSMTILMHILKQRVTLDKGKNLSPLESVIYTQPKQRDTLRIIPVVTSYMDNIFNRRLPLLACRLLRRFAIEFRMSLLACLDMDADHIRVVFLQRLRDEVERDDVKIAILEFVEACIDRQPGLVEAFFSVTNDRRGLLAIKGSKLDTLTEGIPVYMTEYLTVVNKDPEKIANPLLSRIMSLFHEIWRNNMQSLVGDLVSGETFWPSLCSPLFTTINPTVKAYSQLFNIMGIEAFKTSASETMPSKLKECFEKFLKPECFTKWIETVFICSDIEDGADRPEWLCRLQSFKDLMVVLLRRKYPEMPMKSKQILTKVCFQRLVAKTKAADDFRPVIILAELFLVAMENSVGKFVDNEKEDRELLRDSSSLLNCLAISYADIHVRARDAILGAIIEITGILPDDLVDDVETTRSLLCSTVDIICIELMDVEKRVKEKTLETPRRDFSLILAMHLLRKILMILEQHQIDAWHALLESYKMTNRLLSAVNGICHSHENRRVTSELLNLLVVLAKTLRPDYLLHCDVVYYLWLNLLPPKEIYQSQTGAKWHMQDWLSIYASGVELVAVLLQRNKHLFFNDALSFVGVHEEYLIASIMLAKESLEAKSLALIKVVLDLVFEMAKYHRLWRLDHPQSMMNIMRSIQQLMDHAISLLHRPNQLSQLLNITLTSGKTRSEPNPPVQASKSLVTAMNELIEIITLCAKTLLIFSPKIMDLLCEPEFQPSQWQALIEIQFKTPTLNESVRHLSLGALLTAIVTLTKSLKLIQYQFCETPLNFKDVERTEVSISVPADNVTISQSMTTPSPRPGFAKSLSTSSYGAPTPSDEILSKMDGKLCAMALEYCLTLVASQSLLALRDPNLSILDKQLIRKELMSTELAFFHDFVKKRILLNGRKFCERKKYGFLNIPGSSLPANPLDGPEESPKSTSSSKIAAQKDSLRVNVVKKMHLQQKSQPFAGSTPMKETFSLSTPRFEETITPIKRLDAGNLWEKRLCLREEIQFHEGDPPLPPLNIVKLVEEDYLHFLSYLFTVVCHSEV